jgi:D-beta-D-heptose 7-phosphate kinase / D-beta-D-heptose 1-phosphate adenosyltransferase
MSARGAASTGEGLPGRQEARRPLVVVGDAILDVDLTGTASRLCPDDPGPVLDDLVEVIRPGGAGLAALLASRTHPVVLVTSIADDADGDRLRAELEPHVTLIECRQGGSTVVKTRVRAGDRTLLRLDRGAAATQLVLGSDLVDALRGALEGCAGVLASDYGLGMLSQPQVRRELAQVASRLPIVWDPHPRGSAPVPGVTLATPNAAEANRLSGVRGGDLPAAIAQARALARRWGGPTVAVTRGAAGAVVASVAGNPMVVPAPGPAAGDPCGAGDSFAVAATSALAGGASVTEAVQVAVSRAAAYVRQGGAAAASPGCAVARGDDPRDGTPGEAPRDDADHGAPEVIHRVRASGGTVVMAGGCFDLLHAGHVEYLEGARRLGDCLVVALNSDRSVRALKGQGRPLVPESDRRRLLLALRCVDAVVIFDEDTPAALLDGLRPDIFAKGGDYRTAAIPEAATVEAYGGHIVVLPTLSGRSSSRLVQAARAGTASTGKEQQSCQTTQLA